MLAQAVLWVSRGVRPVFDDTFLAAPDSLTEEDLEAAKPLIRCLREGCIQTHGNLFLVDNFQPFEASFLREFTPPSEVFSFASVNLDRSVVDLTPFAEFPDAGYRHVQFRKVKAPVPAELDVVVVLRDVTLPTNDLFALFPEPTAVRGGTKTDKRKPATAGVISTAAAEKRCAEWLSDLMRNGNPEHPKREYLEIAKEKFKVSERGFVRAWRDSASEPGNERWSKAGRKPK